MKEGECERGRVEEWKSGRDSGSEWQEKGAAGKGLRGRERNVVCCVWEEMGKLGRDVYI